jgi:hypothetical protein
MQSSAATKVPGEFEHVRFPRATTAVNYEPLGPVASLWVDLIRLDAVLPRKAVRTALDFIDRWLAAGRPGDVAKLLHTAPRQGVSSDLTVALLTYSRPARGVFPDEYGDLFRRALARLTEERGEEPARRLLKGLE